VSPRPLALLLALALVLPASAAPAQLTVAATREPGGPLVVTWQAPPGQQLACAVCASGRLIACAQTAAGELRVSPGRVVAPGEVVGVRVWDAEGEEIGRGWGRPLRCRVFARRLSDAVDRP
jgi:hypothetical protein